MADKKGGGPGGLIAILAVVAVITIGGVTAASYALWPAAGQGQKHVGADPTIDMFATSTSRLVGFVFYNYADDVKTWMSPTLVDLKAKMPQLKSIVVIDDGGTIVGSDKEADVDKKYQLPKGAKTVSGSKLEQQDLEPGILYVAIPAIYNDKVKGSIRMTIARPAAPAASGGGKNLVLIVGLAALAIGVVVPVVVAGRFKGGAAPAPAAPAIPADLAEKVKNLKTEENFLKSRVDAAKSEVARGEELKTQMSSMEQQIEVLRKQQFEETYKVEGLKKEAIEVASHLEERRKMLDAAPGVSQEGLAAEDKELVRKIDTHRKEELILAKKIEEIRKKVIDLDRRIENRRKEEQEITARIEARKQEEQALSQRPGG